MAKMQTSEDPDGGVDDYQAESDADTLQKHAEITGDKDRHAAAHAKLQERSQNAKKAVAHSGRMMKRTKDGLAKAFPEKESSGESKDESAGSEEVY